MTLPANPNSPFPMDMGCGCHSHEARGGTAAIFMALERIEKIPLPSKSAVYLYQ